MRDQLTIVIPTHNRHGYLARCVRWFAPLGCTIVITDSSATEWTSELRTLPQVRYLHRPGGFEVYLAKLVAAYELVETPLAMMCADDDFALHGAVRSSVEFLTRNSDHEVCCGYYYLFQAFGPRVQLWPMVYRDHDLPEADWQARLSRATSTPYYAVVRTGSMRETFRFLVSQDFAGIENAFAGFVDTTLTWTAARNGKFKRLTEPFGLREYSPVVSSTGVRHRTITSHKIAGFYSALIDHLLRASQVPEDRELLLRLAARDYSGQIAYDLSLGPSRKRKVESLPPALQARAEESFRIATAARMYATSEFRDFAKVFWHPERKRFKDFVSGRGNA
jgi:glycosyltransferase domain-containing protein